MSHLKVRVVLLAISSVPMALLALVTVSNSFLTAIFIQHLHLNFSPARRPISDHNFIGGLAHTVTIVPFLLSWN